MRQINYIAVQVNDGIFKALRSQYSKQLAVIQQVIAWGVCQS